MSALLKTYVQNKPYLEKQKLVKFVRAEMQKEQLIKQDLGYLCDALENWWLKQRQINIHFLKLKLANFFLEHLKHEHINLLSILGKKNHYIAAVCFTNIFKTDSPKLALTVHEALSELFHLNDIKYPYEDHKSLYLKSEGLNFKEWGNGYGEISPHSDDLYENINTDYLSLTVCRDSTNTPTRCFFLKDILASVSDDELSYLLDMKVKLISGKNVNGRTIEKIKKLIEIDPFYGIIANLDFRIDDISGHRMCALNEKDNQLLNKLRFNIANSHFEESIAETGTFFIVANNKVLHSRSTMNIKQNIFNLDNNNMYLPRLLFRSKGHRKANTFTEITKINKEYFL